MAATMARRSGEERAGSRRWRSCPSGLASGWFEGGCGRAVGLVWGRLQGSTGRAGWACGMRWAGGRSVRGGCSGKIAACGRAGGRAVRHGRDGVCGFAACGRAGVGRRGQSTLAS
jgi:hypothetical protein